MLPVSKTKETKTTSPLKTMNMEGTNAILEFILKIGALSAFVVAIFKVILYLSQEKAVKLQELKDLREDFEAHENKCRQKFIEFDKKILDNANGFAMGNKEILLKLEEQSKVLNETNTQIRLINQQYEFLKKDSENREQAMVGLLKSVQSIFESHKPYKRIREE